MAYQFFKAQSKASATSPPPPQSPYNARHNRPSIHPPPPVPPLSSASTASNTSSVPPSSAKPPASTGDTTIQPTAYPHPIPSGYPTPHPHITIETVSTAHIPSLTRITGLLLPIRYPNSFYTATITDPVIASLSRVAIYHDHPVAEAPASPSSSSAPGANLTTGGRNTGTDKVIGGIRCRLERLPQTASGLLRTSQSHGNPGQQPTNLYIQTLHLLSPYRSNGVAASLLNSLLFAVPPRRDSIAKPGEGAAGYRVSELVKHYNMRSITAHVHEANDEGLEWYIARGFQVQEGVVENYYRRLKPSGAKIVKLVLQWNNDDETDDGTIFPEKKDETPTDQDKTGEQGPYDGDDDEDWEKVEAEDEDEQEDHGVRAFMGSKILENDEGGSRKRKAGDEPL